MPDKPSQPRTLLNTGAAGALGLILGLILIFVVNFFDNTIYTEEDVESFTGLNVLGAVPAWRPTGRSVTVPVSPNSTARNLGHAADASADRIQTDSEIRSKQ